MNVQHFPQCCGGVIFTDFGYTRTSADPGKFTEDEINSFLDRQEPFQGKSRGMSFAIVALNDEQDAAIGHIFINRGYVKTGPHFHPKHRTRIFTYTLALHDNPKDVKAYDKDNVPYLYGTGAGRMKRTEAGSYEYF